MEARQGRAAWQLDATHDSAARRCRETQRQLDRDPPSLDALVTLLLPGPAQVAVLLTPYRPAILTLLAAS